MTSDNGPHFEAESFRTFLKDNGVKHRKTTPLWPQVNSEIERQNRSLFKRMQIAQVCVMVFFKRIRFQKKRRKETRNWRFFGLIRKKVMIFEHGASKKPKNPFPE